MKSKPFFLPLLSVLLFLAGIALDIALSSGVVWAELEASLYGTQSDDASLALACPVILSRIETGSVSTSVTNTLDQDVLPVVIAEISSANGPQSSNQTLSLTAHESQSLQWSVNATNIIFGRLILVNISQRRYSDLDPHQGSCGILVLNFFNLTGKEILGLIFFGSLALILIGGILWRRI
ncbi:MAG TPA: hypothetical protein VHM28_01055, partial [Anaerolineales bacterium]|nr:hypothetical protein [Anaerolineales bacterium]